MKTRYHDIKPFITKDGSLIRELMHPVVRAGQGSAEKGGSGKGATIEFAW